MSTPPLKLPNDTTRAAIQRHLERIEEWASRIRKALADLDAGLATTNTNITTINATIAALTLDDLTDVDAASPSNGDTLVFDTGSNKWGNAAPTGGTEVEMGTGAPSGQPATTLIYLDTTGKRIYWRINTTVGTGAQWDYADGTGTYTEP